MRLGWHELVRTPRRFAVLLASTTLLVSLVLVFSGFGAQHLEDLSGAVARADADVLVLDAAAEGAVQASRIDAVDRAAVAAIDDVAEVAPVGEARLGGRVSGALVDVTLWGIDPDGPGIPELVAGRLPRHAGEAVADIGDLAVGLGPGAEVAIAETGDVLTIVGLTEGRRFASIPTVTVTYAQWEAILEAAFPSADDVLPALLAVEAEPGVDPAALAETIMTAHPTLDAATPPELAAALPGVAGVRASFSTATVVGLVAVAAVTGLFLRLNLALGQPALVVLHALGAPRRQLVAAVMSQVAVLVMLASAIAGGLVAGLAAVVPPRYGLSLDPRLLVVTAVATLLVSLLAGLGVVRRVARLDPAAALGSTR